MQPLKTGVRRAKRRIRGRLRHGREAVRMLISCIGRTTSCHERNLGAVHGDIAVEQSVTRRKALSDERRLERVTAADKKRHAVGLPLFLDVLLGGDQFSVPVDSVGRAVGADVTVGGETLRREIARVSGVRTKKGDIKLYELTSVNEGSPGAVSPRSEHLKSVVKVSLRCSASGAGATPLTEQGFDDRTP